MKNYLLLCLLALLTFACNKDDDPDNSNTNNATWNVEKDGVDFEITSTTNSLFEETQGGQNGRRLDLRGSLDGGSLTLTISNWDWQNPPENGVITKTYETNVEDIGVLTECMDIDGITFCDGALGTYTVGTSVLASESFDNTETGVIIITENDPVAKTVSGTFDLKVFRNFDESDFVTLKGDFSNQRY